VLTSKRTQISDVQYPRIPNKILKDAMYEAVVNDVVAEVVISGTVADEAMKYVDLERMECRDIQISCIVPKSLAEPLEACGSQEGLKTKTPKHPEVLARAIRRGPHREAFINDVKSWVYRTGW
jgi:hypothetical protein